MNPSSPEPLWAKSTKSRTATPPYRLYIVAHGFAWRLFTPPYPKGGA